MAAEADGVSDDINSGETVLEALVVIDCNRPEEDETDAMMDDLLLLYSSLVNELDAHACANPPG